MTEIFIEEKEKWKNKGNDKQEEADSLLHNTMEWEMEKWKKMVKNKSNILVFCPTIYLATLKVYKKFEDSEKSVTEILIGEKMDK